MTSRPSIATPVLAMLAIVLVTLGSYVGGYFWLGQHLDGEEYSVRAYPHRWQATFFTPAAWIETKATSHEMLLVP